MDLEEKIKRRTDNVSKFVDKLQKLPNAINVLNSKVFRYNNDLKSLKTIVEKVSDLFINFSGHLIKTDTDKIFALKRFARRTTKPLNYPYFKYKKNKRLELWPYIMHEGIHYIYALPGGGKSSLLFDIFEEFRLKTGYGSMINAYIEKVRYDDVEDKYYRYHPIFAVEDFFGKVFNETTKKYKIQQLKRFPKGFTNIGFDELLSWLNHRINNTGDYLEVFIALIEFLAQRRHRGMKRAYFLNQLDTTDTQLMGAFNYIHEVQVDLDVPYDYWIETGEMTRHIMGWWIDTYQYKKTGKKTADNKYRIQRHYRKKTADFDYFDTLSQKEKYETLPQYQIEGMYRSAA